MTKGELQHWVERSNCAAIGENTVAWVAAESRHGRELAMEWIESGSEGIAAAGWSTLSSLVSITPDVELEIDELRRLLDRVGMTIHQQPNRVRYAMNGFVIAAGSYVADLTDSAMRIGDEVGPVMVDVGETACKIPFSPAYIRRVVDRGTVGRKRKTAKC
jgi:hypothetical protein